MKGPDYTGHAYGPDSPELKETLGELDRQMTRLVELFARKAGTGQTVLAITADHGMPSEPAGGRRHYPDEIVALINQRFDPAGKRVVQYYGDASNNQMYLDTARLRSLGFTLKDVAALVGAQGFIAAAFTEDEVRAAQLRLPSMQ
jgi:predicted AlkP superfamily pyrophosphatase or phosphodiesterase